MAQSAMLEYRRLARLRPAEPEYRTCVLFRSKNRTPLKMKWNSQVVRKAAEAALPARTALLWRLPGGPAHHQLWDVLEFPHVIREHSKPVGNGSGSYQKIVGANGL